MPITRNEMRILLPEYANNLQIVYTCEEILMIREIIKLMNIEIETMPFKLL